MSQGLEIRYGRTARKTTKRFHEEFALVSFESILGRTYVRSFPFLLRCLFIIVAVASTGFLPHEAW